MPVTGLDAKLKGQGSVTYIGGEDETLFLYVGDTADEAGGLDLPTTLQVTPGSYEGIPDIFIHRIRESAKHLPAVQALLSSRRLVVETPIGEAEAIARWQTQAFEAGTSLAFAPNPYTGQQTVGIRKVEDVTVPTHLQATIDQQAQQIEQQNAQIAALTAQMSQMIELQKQAIAQQTSAPAPASEPAPEPKPARRRRTPKKAD
jgi:hypothetical protein